MLTSGIRLDALVVGPLCILAGAIVLLGRTEVADMLYRYGQRVSDPDSAPWWRRGHYRPSERQAMAITLVLSVFGFSFGLIGIIVGVGLV